MHGAMRRSLVGLLTAGCSADPITGPLDHRQPPCPSLTDFFRDAVAAPILEVDCIQCHRADGFAKDSRLILETGAFEANLETIRTIAADRIDGISILLLKPTLELSHGGGQRFQLESPPHAALRELAYRLEHDGACYPGEPPDACDGDGPHPGASPLRPLTAEQYANTVRDLFGGTIDPGAGLSRSPIEEGFSTFISANIVSERTAEEILASAEAIARAATADVGGLLACEPLQSEPDCIAAFVDRFGKRAFRRPLREDERARLRGIGRLDFTLAERIGMIIEVVLESPQFLYLDETGDSEALDDHAIAQRLSYFLWSTMPDDALTDAADRGLLSADPSERRRQAERMIQDPRARATVSRFHREWLLGSGLAHVQKDAATYPLYSAEAGRSMEASLERLTEALVLDRGGSFADLFTTTLTYSDTLLDPIQGATSGSSMPGDLVPVELPSAERAGVLTHPAFLAAAAHDASSSPIARGVFIIRNVFCEELVIPPGLMVGEPPSIEGSTIRERLAVHRDREACAACHDEIDPLGFAFEGYDGIGQVRSTYENGRPVETFGRYAELSISFAGAVELTRQIAETARARDCYATQWFRYAMGRVETPDDCALVGLHDRFRSSTGDVRDLLIGIAESDAFLYRRLE
jgi:hypothetical protein